MGNIIPGRITAIPYSIFQSYYPWVSLEGFEPGLLTVHPTQIYETLIGFGIFAYLYHKRTSITVVGSLFFTYLILAGSERFLIELLRLNTKYLFGLTGSQIISLSMIGIGMWFLTHPINTEQEVSSE